MTTFSANDPRAIEAGESVTFNGRAYTVAKVFGPWLYADGGFTGIAQQAEIVGKRGARRLLQIQSNGRRRTVSKQGRTEYEAP